MGEGLGTQSDSISNSSSKTMMIVLAIGILVLYEIGYSYPYPSSSEWGIRLIAGLIRVSVSVCLPLEGGLEGESCVRMSLVRLGV